MSKKLKVAVIFGGTSTEHEVSTVSAATIIDNLDQSKYEVVAIKITKENTWIYSKELSPSYAKVISGNLVSPRQSLQTLSSIFEDHSFDLAFPIIHGPYGEDGTIQGLLEMLRIPYIGSGVSGSAVCMDKVLQKNICAAYQIPTVPYFWFSKGEWDKDRGLVLQNLSSKFAQDSYPLFVKPANQGSSVGITKAHNQQELLEGIELALTRDLKIVVEQAVNNVREIECSVMGETYNPNSSVLGEIIPDQEFYSYDSKYLTGQSQAIIPAKLDATTTTQIRDCAKLAFQVLDCYGLARIDFLVDSVTNHFYLNEVNTLPGFTPISMYPKLWEATGLTYSDLLDQLIDLALIRHKSRSSLSANFHPHHQ